MPAWRSSDAWFDAVLDALSSQAGEELRRRRKVARGTLMRVAHADRLVADFTTGRGVATANETVATQLGMSAKTVERSRMLLVDLGLAAVIVEGRYLTTAERDRATAAHGGVQVRAASLRALTMPAPRPVENVGLPVSQEVKRYLTSSRVPKTRARSREATAPRSRGAMNRKVAYPPRRPVTPHTRSLADGLAERFAQLRKARPLDVARMLDRLPIELEQWRVGDFAELLDRHVGERGQGTLVGGLQRDPVAYFSWLVRRALDAGGVSPVARRAAADAARAKARDAADAAAQIERARVDSIDHDAVDEILSRIRAGLPQPLPRGRRRPLGALDASAPGTPWLPATTPPDAQRAAP